MNSEERGGLALIAVPTISLLGICVARGGDFSGLGDLTATGPVLGGVGLALAGLTGLVLRSGGSTSAGRVRRVYTAPTGDIQTAKLHEGAHGHMARHFGARVHEMVVFKDTSGYTAYSDPSGWISRLEEAAIARAGSFGSGDAWHGGHCSSDLRDFNEAAKTGWLRRKSTSLARTHCAPGVFGPPSGVKRMARRVRVR